MRKKFHPIETPPRSGEKAKDKPTDYKPIYTNWHNYMDGLAQLNAHLEPSILSKQLSLVQSLTIKNKTRMRSVLLSYLFVLVACFGLYAQAWDGTTVNPFAGEGTSDNPYRIETPAQLAYLAKQVNAGETYAGKHFLQTANLDLGSKTWTPIGCLEMENGVAFKGIYNGNNKNISNLTVSIEHNKSGLFAYIVEGKVQRLGIESGNIQGPTAGAIVAYARKTTIEHCYNKASLLGTADVGGIIGDGGLNCTISYCYNAGNITGTDYIKVGDWTYTSSGATVSGIAGQSAGSITNCYNTGIINSGSGSTASANGITYGAKEIIACYNASELICPTNEVRNIQSGVLDENAPFKMVISNTYYDNTLNKYKGTADDDKEGQSTGLSTQEMQSGEAWEGFDPEIWLFTEGAYPTLKAKESTVANEIVVKEEAYTVVAYGSQVTIRLNEAAPQTFSLVDMAGRTISQQMVTDSYTFTAPGKGVYLIVPSQLNAGVKKIKL